MRGTEFSGWLNEKPDTLREVDRIHIALFDVAGIASQLTAYAWKGCEVAL